jgi:ATP-dependent RNA helicase DDX41
MERNKEMNANKNMLPLTPAQKIKLLKESIKNKTKKSILSKKNEAIKREVVSDPTTKRFKIKFQIYNADEESMKNKVAKNQEDKKIEITTNWKPDNTILNRKISCFDALRQEMRVETLGFQVPPIIPHFFQMNLPKYICDSLKQLNISKPTAVQMQGIPVVLSGRDMVATSSSQTGKSLLYIIPILIHCHTKTIIHSKEGPFCVVLCSTRKAAIDTERVSL